MRRLAAAIAVFCVLGACGGSEGERASTAPDTGSSGESRPFAIDASPDGFELAVAGTGTGRQDWGEDSTGTTQPYAVLVPDGRQPSTENAVVISVLGYQGQEGGFEQSAWGASPREKTTVDGHRAYVTPSQGNNPGHLLVDQGDDLAIRVTAPGADRQHLVRFYEASKPRGRALAPDVDPPDGYQLVGDVNVDLVLAENSSVQPRTDIVPGPPAGHGIGWAAGDAGVFVVSLPETSGDIDALVGAPRFRGGGDTTVRLADGTAEVTQIADKYASVEVVQRAPWGDLLVAMSYGYNKPPVSADGLRSILASAHEVDDDGWDAVVADAHGGSGLQPDRGAVELSRGEANGVGWLLQAVTGPPGLASSISPDSVPIDEWSAHSCLKLANGKHACATGSWGDEVTTVTMSGRNPGQAAGASGLPPFMIVNTPREAATAVLYDSGGDIASAPLVRVPGSTARWSAALFTTDAHAGDWAACRPGATYRLELRDASNGVIDCVGM